MVHRVLNPNTVSSAGLVLFASLVHANSFQAELDATVLARARTVGMSGRWRQKTALVSTFLPVQTSTTVDENVTEVDPDGSYTIRRTQGKVNVSWGFESLMTPNESTTTVLKFGPLGELLKIDAEPETKAWIARQYNLQVVAPPSFQAKIGDRWEHEFSANSETGAVRAHGKYRLVGTTTNGSSVFFQVQVEVAELEGSAPASSSGTVIIRQSDGAVVAVDLKLTDAAVPGIPGLASGELHLTRLDPPQAG